MDRNSEKEFDDVADLVKGRKAGICYCNPAGTCDKCGDSLKSHKYMIDGSVRGSTVWGNYCSNCYAEFGRGIGWGHGQLYMQTRGKRWLLVGGFPPDDSVGREDAD